MLLSLAAIYKNCHVESLAPQTILGNATVIHNNSQGVLENKVLKVPPSRVATWRMRPSMREFKVEPFRAFVLGVVHIINPFITRHGVPSLLTSLIALDIVEFDKDE